MYSRFLSHVWWFRRLAPLILSLTLATGISAQTPDVHVDLTGKRVVAAEGRETFVDADKAKPNDIIQYEAVCRNTGKETAKSVAATVPVPTGMALLADSAKPAAELASLDGKTFNPAPLMREVKNEAGVVEKKPVPLTEYRALRWNLAELAAGQSASVSLRVRVLGNAASK